MHRVVVLSIFAFNGFNIKYIKEKKIVCFEFELFGRSHVVSPFTSEGGGGDGGEGSGP